MWKRLIVLGLAGLVSVAPALRAQQSERRTEEQRAQEARRRLEAAQKQLAAALQELENTRTEEARRQLELLTRQILAAQQQLRATSLEATRPDVVRAMPGGYAYVTSGSNYPQMGVFLSSDAGLGHGGAELQSVVAGGPADEAGLKAGDIITKANGHSLVDERRPATRLVEIKNAMNLGDTLQVEYRRGSETGSASVVLDRVDTPYTVYGTGTTVPGSDISSLSFRGISPRVSVSWGLQPDWLDVELIKVDDHLGKYFGTTDGLLVVRAPTDQTLQLQGGDVILQVDGREPEDPAHLFRILRSYAPGETMHLTVMRDQRRQTLTVTMPERDDGFFWRNERR